MVCSWNKVNNRLNYSKLKNTKLIKYVRMCGGAELYREHLLLCAKLVSSKMGK
jgi:hypothetical protein